MSAILRSLASVASTKDHQDSHQGEVEPNTPLELLINRMEDGFSKIYMQLEAMDEKLQEVQGLGDKVDMLEASVRLLENNAMGSAWTRLEQSPSMDSPANMSLSSSSLQSVHTVTSVTSRNPPRRNHTIGNIKYDSAAYKVSFNLEDDNDSGNVHEDFDNVLVEDDVASYRLNAKSTRKRTLSSGSNKQSATNKQAMDSIDETATTSTSSTSTTTATATQHVVPTIVRSKSFSNNFEYVKKDLLHANEDSVFQPIQHQQTSPSRSRSLRLHQQQPHSRSSRLSWIHQDLPDHNSLKDTKLRGSYTSLASLDMGGGGSGATTPTPTSVKGATLDVSARELMQRPTVHHSGNLEMKKSSGFSRSYKRYWAVLDSNFLYFYGKEKDSKAKNVIDVSGSTIIELSSSSDNNSGHNSANGGQNNLSSSSFRESLKKRGGRSFEMVFNNSENRWFAAQTKEEAEEWMKKLKEAAAFKCYDDHAELVAVEQAYEEEVVHEVTAASNPSASSSLGNGNQQEWRLAIKNHSRNPSRYWLRKWAI